MQVFPARHPETGLLLPDELVTAVTGGRFGLECSVGRLVRGDDLVEGPGRVEQDNELALRITIEAVSGPGFCDVFDGAAPRYGERTPTEAVSPGLGLGYVSSSS